MLGRMRVRLLLPLGLLVLVLAVPGFFYFRSWLQPSPAGSGPADLVRVDKSDRRMELMRRGEVIRAYRVSLGSNPRGHKQKEGDGRTPEGRYRIDWRNPRSKFHRSLHISYPNPQDRHAARAQGVSPGGAIMIHGLPNGWGWAAPFFALWDWTDGCIAVSDAEMDEVWNAVADGTPIEILP
jgi:murein L,D-transpeptidase YafK